MLLRMDRRLPPPETVFRHIPCMCASLMLAARAMTRLYNEELRAVGLEATQHSVLFMLKNLGPMTMKELGDRLAVDKTTVSRSARVLERNGWVSVEQGRDARQRILALTDAGRQTLDAARPHWERAQARIRAALPEGQFDSIRRGIPDLALAAMAA